jgi:iron complex outermembrane recepter protein
VGGALSRLDEVLVPLTTKRPFRLRGPAALSASCLLLLLGGLWTPRGTLAQTASSLTHDDEPETITVSARRRDEPLAKVPESVTVFTAESLATFDIQSFNDYATKSPNLSFEYGSGSTGISNARTVAVRGISGQNLFGTAGATGFYIDDTPVPESLDPRVLDVDRLEILKGPQGTLFGQSSLGGNVRLITKRPDLSSNDLSFMAQAGATSGGGSPDGGATVIGNIAVIPEQLGVRVVLFGNHDAGYLTRSFPSANSPAVGDPFVLAPRTSVGDQGAQTTFGGSVTALLKAAGGLEARLRIMFQNIDDRGFPATFAPLPAFEPVYTLDRAFDIQPRAKDHWMLPSLDLSYRGDGFSVVSSTSYFYRQNSDIEDSTYGTQQVLHGYYGVATLPNQPFLWDQEHYHNQVTEELRLSFDIPHGEGGTVGAFYSRARSLLEIPPIYATGLSAATVDNTVIGPWPNDLLWTDHNPALQEDISLFGEASWKFLPSLTATVGARKYWLRQVTDFTADGFNNGGPTLSDPQRSRQSGLNPKAGLAYQATDTTMIYVSAAEGFRAGGAQPYLPFCALATLPVDDITHLKSDTLWSYELGTKVEIPRTGLIASVAAFHIDWNNLQQQVALPCGAYFDINGRLARINGAETEVAGRLVPWLEVRAAAGIEHTSISEPGPLAIVGILPGSRILGTPAWNASLGAVLTHPVSSNLEGFFAADYSYTGNSESLLNGGNGTLATRPAFGLAHFRAGVRRDRSELSLNVHNLTNARPNLGDIGYVGYAQYNSAGTIIPQVATLQPLTVVLQYRHDF